MIPTPAGWTEQNGIAISPDPVSADSEYPEYIREWLAGIEPGHFWFRSRAALIARVVRSSVPAGGWLELGCGTGFVLAATAHLYDGASYGQEVSRAALEIARTRVSCPLYWCREDKVPLSDLGGVGLFDVIEHLPDDVGALRLAGQYVRPGGAVLITVPAHQQLWSELDSCVGHQRRYSRRALTGAMTQAGLQVAWCRPFFGCLVPGMLLRRAGDKGDAEAVIRRLLQTPPAFLNAVLYAMTAVESRLTTSGLLPVGSSWIALGTRPGSPA